jgi:hypothetical protein
VQLEDFLAQRHVVDAALFRCDRRALNPVATLQRSIRLRLASTRGGPCFTERER